MIEDDSRQIGLDFSIASKEAIELFMDETSDAAVFEEIYNANKSKVDIVRLLYDHPETPEEVRVKAASVLSLPVLSQTQVAEIKKVVEDVKSRIPEEKKRESLMLRIQRLGVSEKVKLALKGSSEARGILMKDSNKLVSLAVLDNPRITHSEILAIARNRSALEESIRTISNNKEWMKVYSVVMALVTNPKTPPGIAVKFVGGISPKDLKLLEKNRGVSEAVRLTAKRTLQSKKV